MKKNLLKEKLQKRGGENKMKKLIIAMIVLAFVISMNVQAVQAVPIPPDPKPTTPYLWLSDGTNSVLVTDNGVGDLDPTLGKIVLVNLGLGIWNSNIDIGYTKPFIGSAQSPEMDLQFGNSSSAAGTLWIWFVDSGFDFTGGLSSDVGGTLAGGTTGTIDFWKVIDYQTFINHLSFIGSGSFSGTTGSNVSLDPTNSLGILMELTHNGAGITTGNDYNSVPEPGVLVLLGSGLLGLAFYARRRKK
ncbi:MAG: PEP-CTERM sorting domain-containing protein [Thermodesulfovibrionales bacterium]